jgi:ATP-dependent Lon protease
MSHGKILVVDDEENFLRLLSRTLTKEGYTIRTAGDGKKAIACLEQERFDLAVVDVQMPQIDGMALLRQIRKRYPGTRIILITGFPTAEGRALALQEGAVEYLSKPVEISDLKKSVRNTLSHIDGLVKSRHPRESGDPENA